MNTSNTVVEYNLKIIATAPPSVSRKQIDDYINNKLVLLNERDNFLNVIVDIIKN